MNAAVAPFARLPVSACATNESHTVMMRLEQQQERRRRVRLLMLALTDVLQSPHGFPTTLRSPPPYRRHIIDSASPAATMPGQCACSACPHRARVAASGSSNCKRGNNSCGRERISAAAVACRCAASTTVAKKQACTRLTSRSSVQHTGSKYQSAYFCCPRLLSKRREHCRCPRAR